MLGCGEDRGQACDTGRHQNEFPRLRPVSQILASASSAHLRRSQPMAYSHMRTHESICSWAYMFCAKWTNRYARGRPPLVFSHGRFARTIADALFADVVSPRTSQFRASSPLPSAECTKWPRQTQYLSSQRAPSRSRCVLLAMVQIWG